MNFKKYLNKLPVFLILFSFFIIPINIYAYQDKVIIGGETIGINLNSKGVMVVGFYSIGNISPGLDAGLQKGDIITKVSDNEINSVDDLSNVLYNKQSLEITYERNKQNYKTNLNLINENNIYKTGLYVKDKIIGVGTITFIDQNTNTYGALGHEIKESTTSKKFEISTGKIYNADVTNITRSKINSPGEKNANFNEVIGNIEKNVTTGIFGKYQGTMKNEFVQVADNSEITLGNAYIRTVLENNTVGEYSIEIKKINLDDASKNILFKVTDKELLDKTNGIVQGMSGSPIIQNNKLIGAVNYVVVNNPEMGYGVLINNMLKEMEQ